MKSFKRLIGGTVLGLTLAVPAYAEHSDNSALYDAWLDGKLSTTVLFNQHLNPFKIETDVVDGEAIITGKVYSSVHKSLATELALGIEGIRDVENRLVVEGQEESSADRLGNNILDSSITTAITTKFLLNGDIEATRIDVDTDDQIVTLNGEVDSAAASELAEQIASNTFDVKSVTNKLEIIQ